MATTEFQINGLTREVDGAGLARTLCSMPGVAVAQVDVTTGTVTLVQAAPSPRATEAARRLVRDAGYELASEVTRAGVPRRARLPLRRRVRQPVPLHG